MNLLSIAAVLIVPVVAVLVSLLMVGAYRKFRGRRIVTCPETGQAVAVEVDARFAAATAVLGEPSLRLKSCSRWPEHKDCDQACLEQIQAAPEELLAQWSAGKVCALCGRPLSAIGHYPALMDSSGRTLEWKAFPPEKIPEALATHQPVCWNCHHGRVAPPALPGAADRVALPASRSP